MGKLFEVGKKYEASDPGLDPIKVLKITEHTITVTNGRHEWRMRLKVDSDGVEYVEDSKIPARFRSEYTYKASWEV